MRRLSGVVVSLLALVATACGPAPLESLGWRSSEWINEPTVPTTTPAVTTVPTDVPAIALQWANDQIIAANLEDPAAVAAAVFARRQGDRFIQASRQEIAAALPEVTFPGEAPPGAEWVSSQLVFENDGSIADDPSAAFGIWSAEPYSRSRSVAQMIVMRVSNDLVTATELASGEVEATCDLFAERTTDKCEMIVVGDRDTWVLTAPSGATLVWYDGPYRYELYGRTFVPVRALEEMSADMVPLTSLAATSS